MGNNPCGYSSSDYDSAYVDANYEGCVRNEYLSKNCADWSTLSAADIKMYICPYNPSIKCNGEVYSCIDTSQRTTMHLLYRLNEPIDEQVGQACDLLPSGCCNLGGCCTGTACGNSRRLKEEEAHTDTIETLSFGFDQTTTYDWRDPALLLTNSSIFASLVANLERVVKSTNILMQSPYFRYTDCVTLLFGTSSNVHHRIPVQNPYMHALNYVKCKRYMTGVDNTTNLTCHVYTSGSHCVFHKPNVIPYTYNYEVYGTMYDDSPEGCADHKHKYTGSSCCTS